MVNEKRLTDANEALRMIENSRTDNPYFNGKTTPVWEKAHDCAISCVIGCPTVDAVEVPDKKLLKAINLLIKQYEHSKNSDYVHSPVAHAFYYTWKQLDEKMDGDGK